MKTNKGNDNRNCKGKCKSKNEMRGSLHYAARESAVRSSGRDDAVFGRRFRLSTER
jgi:hypothetical protein